MNLTQWQKRAERGTSGDMVHNILMDWERENVTIDGNGWYCYTCATTFARPGDCPICLGKLVEPPPPQPDDALLTAAKQALVCSRNTNPLEAQFHLERAIAEAEAKE